MKIKSLFKLLIGTVFLSGLTSCLDDSEDIRNIVEGSQYAIVEYAENGELLLRSSDGYLFFSEDLQDKTWDLGTPVWVYHSIDWYDQPYKDKVVSKIQQINRVPYFSAIPKEESFDKTSFQLIEELYFPEYINKNLFFWVHFPKEAQEKKFSYDIFYEENEAINNLYTIYIIAKENASESFSSENGVAMSVNNFIASEGETKGRDKISVMIKYATEINKDGELVFKTHLFPDSSEVITIWEKSK